MVTEAQIRELVEAKIADSGQFIVSLTSSETNDFMLEMDGDKGFGIDDCTALHRHIRYELGEAAEDLSLKVSSAGLDKPLRHPRQFAKNIGRPVEVLTMENSRVSGELIRADESGIALRFKERIKEGKRKKTVERELALNHDEIRETKIVIRF